MKNHPICKKLGGKMIVQKLMDKLVILGHNNGFVTEAGKFGHRKVYVQTAKIYIP